MLTDFMPRFMALVDQLMAHPRVRITHLWVGAPATDAGLAELARVRGGPLPAVLVGLYRQADGVQLRWIDVGEEMFDPGRDGKMHMDGPWERLCDLRGVATGLLDLPRLAELGERDTVGEMMDAGDDDEDLRRGWRSIVFRSRRTRCCSSATAWTTRGSAWRRTTSPTSSRRGR